ncbi:MAG: hypothetical protein METHAR1v1_1210005 [Methanothrix sp.]|nr:MAG: hypothetical protein METHAR1v1_1210005 [Methanothrix sp.]
MLTQSGGRGLAAASADELSCEDDDEEGEEEVSEEVFEYRQQIPVTDSIETCRGAPQEGDCAEI